MCSLRPIFGVKIVLSVRRGSFRRVQLECERVGVARSTHALLHATAGKRQMVVFTSRTHNNHIDPRQNRLPSFPCWPCASVQFLDFAPWCEHVRCVSPAARPRHPAQLRSHPTRVRSSSRHRNQDQLVCVDCAGVCLGESAKRFAYPFRVAANTTESRAGVWSGHPPHLFERFLKLCRGRGCPHLRRTLWMAH
jgi:hypothetical protein